MNAQTKRSSLADYFAMTYVAAYSLCVALQPNFAMFLVLTIPVPVLTGLYLRYVKNLEQELVCCRILTLTLWGSILFFGISSHYEMFNGHSQRFLFEEDWSDVAETMIFGLFYSGFAGLSNISLYSAVIWSTSNCFGAKSITENRSG